MIEGNVYIEVEVTLILIVQNRNIDKVYWQILLFNYENKLKILKNKYLIII